MNEEERQTQPQPSTGGPAAQGGPERKEIGSNRAHWALEDTDPELAEKIRKSLRTVVDPEIGIDVVTLGLVRDLRKTDEGLHMVMILTTPFCPYGPALLEMARQKVEQVSGQPTTLEIGREMWDLSMVEDGEVLKQWGLWM